MLQSRIRRGQMDRQITFIQKEFDTAVTNEDPIAGWDLIATNPTVWAKVEQKAGRELVVADQIQSIINTTFIIDWRSDVTEKNRVVLDSKVFNIISVSEHEGSRKGFLFLQAESIPEITFTVST